MSLPLALPAFDFDATAYAQVTVIDNYSTAQVGFFSADTTVYQVTLLCRGSLCPDNLQLGTFTLLTGTLSLQVLSANEPGLVTLHGTYSDATTSNQGLNAVLGMWTLNE